MKIKDVINKNYNNDFILDIINNTNVDKDAVIIDLLNIVNNYNFNLVDDLKFDLRVLQNEYDELEADYSDLESDHDRLKTNYDGLEFKYKELTEPLANEQIIKIKKEIEEAKSKKLLNIANQNFESAVVDRDIERALTNKLNEYIKNHLLDYIVNKIKF